jgi:CheY-like chemotaxis protein
MSSTLDYKNPAFKVPAISGAEKKVLIVDDDPLVTQSIQHLLKRMELASLSASQWAEAMDVLERERPDLMLLDMRMPNVDGPTLLEFVRESGFEMPVVVVSASLNEVDLERLRELGVKRFVPKPFSVEQLRGIIEEQLNLTLPIETEEQDEAKQAVAVSSSQSVLGRRWRPKAGVRKERQRQFWTIALVCVGLSAAAFGAKWALSVFMPVVDDALEEQSRLNQK